MNPEWVETARYATDAATRAFLGDALPLTDEDCRAPSLLPGWTRGHVLTHVAEHASALAEALEGALVGEAREIFAGRDRDADIEAGAGRTALELLTHVDSTAHLLADTYAKFAPDQWDNEVSLRDGTRITAGDSLRLRLTEVAIHHVDLDLGHTVDDIDPVAAELILQWVTRRLPAKGPLPDVTLVADSGERYDLGAGGPEVTGRAQQLIGWLTNRVADAEVAGAEGIQMPKL